MKFDLDIMMKEIVNKWDKNIFYYGSSIELVGYSDEIYGLLGYKDKREFETDEFFSDFDGSMSIGGNQNIGEILNKHDKDLLHEHAESLFDGVVEKDKVYRYMLKLAMHLNRYRYLKTRESTINELIKMGKPKIRKHYSTKEKEEKLRKLAKEMMSLMGGKSVAYENITPALRQIIETPECYIPKTNFRIMQPKQVIKDYLFGLHLKKSDEINNFIQDIE